MEPTILIVDDDTRVTRSIQRLLAEESYRIYCADSASKAIHIVQNETIDVVITDERMPIMKGNEFLLYLKENHPQIVRILITGAGDTDSAYRAINEGEVYRYLSKPCNGLDILTTVRQAVEYKRLLEILDRAGKVCRRQLRQLQSIHARPSTKPEKSTSPNIRVSPYHKITEYITNLETELEQAERLINVLEIESVPPAI